MKGKRFLAAFFAFIMAFSAVSVGEFIAEDSSIVAYAASLSAPKVTAKAATYKSIKLSWKKVKGAKKYIVMRSTKKKSGYKKIKTVKKNSYTDSKASCGKTYYYKVVAVSGSVKKTSKPVKIKCTPAKVSTLSVTSSACGVVTVSFKAVKGASGYSIAYSSEQNGKYKTVANVTQTSYTHAIGVGSTGYYKVRAYRTVKSKKIYGAYSSVKSAVALSHNYGAWTVVSPASCNVAGLQTSSCSVCSDTIHMQIDALTHNYQAEVVSPTCTTQGYTRHTCTTCGDSYTDSYVDALGHDFGSYTVETSATCGTAGTKYTTCSRCGERQTATISATGEHVYMTKITASCTEDGEIITVCTVCGKVSKSEPYEALGHSYVLTNETPATCITEGQRTYTCSLCGNTYDEPIPVLSHTYTLTSEVAPTCTAAGQKTYTCSLCGNNSYDEQYGEALGHDFSGAVEANGDGTHKVYCSREGCGEYTSLACTLVREVTKEPTYTEDGEAVYTCSVCGYTKTEVIPANTCAHTTTETQNAADATCTEAGYSGDEVCTVCNQVIVTGNVINPLGHNFSGAVEANGDGTHKVYCANGCGEYETVVCASTASAKQYTVKTVTLEDGTAENHLYDICAHCAQEYETDTLSLDLTGIKDRDLTALAGVAELSPTKNKLTLTATKYIDNFELSGSVNDITVSVDAFDNADIRLNGLTILNSDTTIIDDCIRINDKCTTEKQSTDDDGKLLYNADGTPVMEKIVPTVDITAQNGTTNTLKVTAAGGNAVQCETKLEFKGHGTLVMNTVSTAVDARAKVDIKNITMNITSQNRGIDTKLETKNEAGLITSTEYSNIDFGANANVTVNTYDDGIRCKNMEFEAIDAALGEVGSVVNITSTAGDALQLEGKKGLTMYQGTMTLVGGKSNLNNKSGIEPTCLNGAVLNK